MWFAILFDITYTTKERAEISGNAAQKIHMAEIDFLRNIEYTLLVSQEEWRMWPEKLQVYHEYLQAPAKPSISESTPAPVIVYRVTWPPWHFFLFAEN